MEQASQLQNLSAPNLLELARKRAEAISLSKTKLNETSDVLEWIESNFFIPETKGPLVLYPHQRAVLNRALTRKADGTFPYSTIVWSDIKKSAKSTIAAAVGTWMAFQNEWGSVIVVANDLKQADSRVGLYMRRAIELNPRLKQLCKIRNYSIDLPNRAKIESVAIDPSGEAGSNADMVIFSELWGAHQTDKQRMWTEMTLPPGKFGHSFRWVETYAGYVNESPLLEQLYRAGVKEGKLVDVGIDGLELYENEAARLLVLWNTQPRLPWQTPEYYAQESAVLIDSEFQRVHRNQWISSSQTFIPIEWWDACKGEMPTVTKDTQMVFGIDAAVSNDNFAVVGVSRHQGKIAVRYVKRWVPPKGGKINFAEVEKDIRQVSKDYNIVEFAYDPYQLHDMASRLQADGCGWFRPFNQNTERLISDKHLYDIVRERRLVHSGDTTLREHIENCNAEIKNEEHKLRIIKKTDDSKIDLAVALSMAAREAARLHIGD